MEKREAPFIMRLGRRMNAKTKRGQGMVKKCALGNSYLSQVDQLLRGSRRGGDWEREKSVQYHFGAVIRDITKMPSFQLTETHIRLELAQCHLLLRV